jgi:hypothetical protein
VKYLLANGAKKVQIKNLIPNLNNRKIKSNNYELIDKMEKGNEKWINKLPSDIWFYILNEFFDTEFEQTKQLLKLSQVSKLLYNELLSNELNLNNFTFSLKRGVKLCDIVNEMKPSYIIRNLSLICVRNEISNEDLINLKNENYFNLYKLDISFCNLLNDESFQYFSNVKVLEMVMCDQIEKEVGIYSLIFKKSVPGISNEGLKKLTKLRELNMIACDQKAITNKVFKSIGSNLVKLDISCCYQFTNEIFNYLRSDCKVKMNKLNLKRN